MLEVACFKGRILLNDVICYYIDFVNLNVDKVDKVMHLLVLSIPCFINSTLFNILEKNKHRFVIKASKIMSVRGPGLYS